MKLRKLLFSITILLNTGVFSQSAMGVICFGYKAGPTLYKGFNRLSDNYNQANPTNKTRLSHFGASTGYWYSVDAVTSGIYMSFYHHSTNAIAVSEISDYKTRR